MAINEAGAKETTKARRLTAIADISQMAHTPTMCSLIMILGYVPSVDAATAMLAIYVLVALWAVYLSHRVRLRGGRGTCCCGCCCRCCGGDIHHWSTVLPVTAIMLIIGFEQRREMVLNFGAWPYLFSLVFILVAPVVLAIMNYKQLGKLLESSGLHVKGCSPHAISAAFVAMDVLCVILQVVAGVTATLAVSLGMQLLSTISHGVLLGSFLLQLAMNAVFTALILWAQKQDVFNPNTSPLPNMKQVWGVMWSTVCLLWIRNLYRAGEGFAVVAGTDRAMASDGLFYAFEVVPVLLCCIIFCTWHYGLLLPVKGQELAALLPAAGPSPMALAKAPGAVAPKDTAIAVGSAKSPTDQTPVQGWPEHERA